MSDHVPAPVAFSSPAIERVFPIRNDILAGKTKETKETKDVSKTPPPMDHGGPLRIIESLLNDGAVVRAAEVDSDSPKDQDQTRDATIAPPYLPPPFPHVPPESAIRRILPQHRDDVSSDSDGSQRSRTGRTNFVDATTGPPGVFPGIISEPSQQKFHRCEDEPIHMPGAVQQFGALLALRYNEHEKLEVRIASENSRLILGYSSEQLFKLESFFDIADDASHEDMVVRITNVLEEASTEKPPNEDTHLDVFSATIYTPDKTERRLWCALHISKGTNDLVILEFEEHSDVFNFELGPNDKTLPDTPTRTVDLEIHPEERLKSTTSESVPLRVLRIARQKKESGISSMNLFNAMTQAQQQLASAKTVQQTLDLVVGIISELTGFHRVMFYRFDSHKNGCIDAELVNPQASSDMFRGLHFPASDIPEQARELYKINRIRMLYDRDAETARLVCREPADFSVPLDLSHSYLRAMSPVHLKYLSNMGVRSSMSVSIVINEDLWGLVACHGYGDFGIRVGLPIRELCRNIGECAATNIERLLMIQRIEARKPLQKTPPTQHPASFITASSSDLLRAFDADFGLLSIRDEARAIGKLEPYREALAILTYLQSRNFTSVIASQNINADFPDINYPPGINTVCGCLVIPLNMFGNDFMVFFRIGQLREIRWAGNPYEKIKRAGDGYLEPRMSFKRWTETVAGLSKDWTEDHLETASVLSLLYGRFIEIWRQKDVAGQNNRLTRLLIRNSSHEVRTPLNAIVNYLELALENPIDEATREILSKAHTASRSLIYVIDDLLNLTKAEDGPVVSPGESFDLAVSVAEVVAQFKREGIRKGLDLVVSDNPGIPEFVKGDSSRLRQVLSNIISNAFQYSLQGGIKIDTRSISREELSSVISITVQDSGVGMSESQLDNLFQEFEQVIDEDNMSSRTILSKIDDEQKSLGVGLAVVARYIKNVKGQIRVQSELGKGTIFGIEIPFEHASPMPLTSPMPMPNMDPASVPLPGIEDSVTLKALSNMEISSSKKGKAAEISLPAVPQKFVFPLTPSEHSQEMASPGVRSDGAPSSNETTGSTYPFPVMDADSIEFPRESMAVLIAEDNPINAKLLTRRLVKLGHTVELVYDGQECHDYFASKPHSVDVILMDIQMPLVDGMVSTKMIRHYEETLVELQQVRPRVPIIAVSASLAEGMRAEYVQHGFDAWILKPIDFRRLDFLLRGVKYPELKQQALYAPGMWEKGGWLTA